MAQFKEVCLVRFASCFYDQFLLFHGESVTSVFWNCCFIGMCLLKLLSKLFAILTSAKQAAY